MTFKENLLEFLTLEEANKLLDSLKAEDYHAVLLNPKKINKEDFISLFPHVTSHPYVENAFIYDKNEYPLGKSIYHELGYFYLQEPSAMMVSSLLNISKGDLVLDLCAAPGGKSIGASFKLDGTGLIISNDLSRPRCSLIVENAERLGLENLLIVNNDFEKIYQDYLEKFDAIILDAPCSGSGMFRKDDKMIADWSINKVYKFAEIQKSLISIAYQMLKPGGTLSYSTCSYSIEEDEEVIEYLLSNTDAEILPLPYIEKAYINKNKPIGIRMMPSNFNGEGQYICQIKKLGNKKPTAYENGNKYKKELPSSLEDKDVQKYGNTYFYLNNAIKVKGLNVVRYGVKIGEDNKDIFRFDLHYARVENRKDLPSIELRLEEVKEYLYGNVIRKSNPYKGYIYLIYQNNPIDIAKTDGEQIKNYYPKGLRKRFN